MTEELDAEASPAEPLIPEAPDAKHIWIPKLLRRPVLEYPVTSCLILANTLVAAQIPFLCGSCASDPLLSLGVSFGPFVFAGQWWRLLTADFIHFQLGHFLWNMLFLWIFGKRLERFLGSWTFLAFYLTCSIFGDLVTLAVFPMLPAYGASIGIDGVVAGVIVVYASRFPRLPVSTRWMLVLLAAFSVVGMWTDLGISDDANPGHVGGFLTGMFLVLPFLAGWMGTIRRCLLLFTALTGVAILLAVQIWRQESYVVDVYAAIEASEAGNPVAARRKIETVLRAHPDSLQANRVAARIFLDLHDWPSAEATARTLLARRAGDPQATLVLIVVDKRTGRCAEADPLEGPLVRHHNEYAWYVSKLICAPSQAYDADVSWPGSPLSR